MKIGEKPISEMTLEERIEAVRNLQELRAALTAENVKKFKEKQVEKKMKKDKAEAKVAVAETNAEALRLLGL